MAFQWHGQSGFFRSMWLPNIHWSLCQGWWSSMSWFKLTKAVLQLHFLRQQSPPSRSIWRLKFAPIWLILYQPIIIVLARVSLSVSHTPSWLKKCSPSIDIADFKHSTSGNSRALPFVHLSRPFHLDLSMKWSNKKKKTTKMGTLICIKNYTKSVKAIYLALHGFLMVPWNSEVLADLNLQLVGAGAVYDGRKRISAKMDSLRLPRAPTKKLHMQWHLSCFVSRRNTQAKHPGPHKMPLMKFMLTIRAPYLSQLEWPVLRPNKLYLEAKGKGTKASPGKSKWGKEVRIGKWLSRL